MMISHKLMQRAELLIVDHTSCHDIFVYCYLVSFVKLYKCRRVCLRVFRVLNEVIFGFSFLYYYFFLFIIWSLRWVKQFKIKLEYIQ